MRSENLGYNDPKYEELAKQNRFWVNELNKNTFTDKYISPQRAQILQDVKHNTDILINYLWKTYPEKFSVRRFDFEGEIPNIPEEGINILDNPEIQEIWDEIIEEYQYTPQIHDIIRIMDEDVTRLIFFIDEHGIYVIKSSTLAPDEFYDFLERLGLYDIYLHINTVIEFKNNKWPRVVNIKEKL